MNTKEIAKPRMFIIRAIISLLFIGIIFPACTTDPLPVEKPGENTEQPPPIVIDKPDLPLDSSLIPTWVAYPVSTIDDGAVTLEFPREEPDNLWSKPTPATLKPDSFEIYMSKDDALNFEKIASLEFNGASPYRVEGLENGSAYFFYISSIRQGVERGQSEVIMTTPNRKKAFEVLFKVDKPEHTILHLTMSPDRKKVAYLDNYNSMRIASLDGTDMDVLEIEAGEFFFLSWSPSSDKIVFVKVMRLPMSIFSQLALYDCKTKTVREITYGNDFHFLPSFLPDGNSLFYTATINGADSIKQYFRVKNLKTSEESEVVFSPEIHDIGFLSWIDNDRFYFSGIETNKHYQVYEGSLSERKAVPVFSYQWIDSDPSLSPDGKKLAFLSHRSGGLKQIWVYDFETKKYTQVTGYAGEDRLAYWSNETRIDWVNNNTIQFVTNENRLVRQEI